MGTFSVANNGGILALKWFLFQIYSGQRSTFDRWVNFYATKNVSFLLEWQKLRVLVSKQQMDQMLT